MCTTHRCSAFTVTLKISLKDFLLSTVGTISPLSRNWMTSTFLPWMLMYTFPWFLTKQWIPLFGINISSSPWKPMYQINQGTYTTFLTSSFYETNSLGIMSLLFDFSFVNALLVWKFRTVQFGSFKLSLDLRRLWYKYWRNPTRRFS